MGHLPSDAGELLIVPEVLFSVGLTTSSCVVLILPALYASASPRWREGKRSSPRVEW